MATLLLCVLSACSTAQTKIAGVPSPDAIDPIRNADLSAHFPATDGRSNTPRQSPRPLLYPGSGTNPEVPPSDSGTEARVASVSPVAIVPGGGVEINFEDADISTVAKSLLGDVLQLNFAVDPRVQGNVTLASAGTIPRKDVLPVLEGVLRMSNAAIVHDGKLVKIVPIPEASGHAAVGAAAAQPGFGVSVVPLQYVSASTVARTAENFVSRPGAIRVDPSRNFLLIQGTTSERQAVVDLIATFDVEWLRNQSVGVYPLKSTSPETIIQDLDRIFETNEGGQGQGVIRFQPVSRMNAVMVVTKNPSLLKQTTQWVQRLDRSDPTGTTVRTYRVKYGNAPQLAKILNDIFVGQRSGAIGDSPVNQIAPGAGAVRSRLDSLDRGTTGGSAADRSSGAVSTTPATNATSRVATTFDSFSDRKGSDGEIFGAAPAALGGTTHGLFPNVRITADAANNSVVVYSNQDEYRAIERQLREMDRARLQVAIDATVAEVTLTDSLQYGVQYFLTSSDAKIASDKGSAGLFNAAQSTAQSSLLQRVLPGFNLLLGSEAQPRVILSALSSLTDVKVLSAPSLVVMDNQPALLQVGDEIPISTGTATVLANSNTPIVNTIEMRSTGVILKVLPHVYSNGTIELEIEQEISNVANPTQQTLTPTISQRRIRSTVTVTSGQTVLLGGLISEREQRDNSGIPGLSQIKYLGDLFGNKSATKQRSEIIIFIRPQMVRNGIDARNVTEEFRERLGSMRSTRSVVNGTGVSRASGSGQPGPK
jgi:general secretion pathway protein D